MQNENDKKVPVTIITGFLGAGKTTLLNYLLTANHGKRIVIIQNEFGEQIGLESAMVIGKDGNRVQEWLEFPNGCICCTVRDDLVTTLENLVNRKDKFDYLIIETTGMADPGPLAKSLWLDDALESSLYLDAIVTIVDAKYFEKQLNENKPDGAINEAQRQVAFGDIILINKTDLVTKEDLTILEKRILQVNAIAPRIITQFSIVPLDKILNIKAFDVEKALQVDNQFTTDDHVHKGDHCDHDSHKKRHDNEIHSVFFEVSGSTTLEKLNQWFASILWENEIDCKIFRIKGVASIQDESEKYIVQGVNDNFDIKPSGFTWESQNRINKFVFIGKHLDSHHLKYTFVNKCLL